MCTLLPGSTRSVYPVKSHWLTAQCEASFSTLMLSDTPRATSLIFSSFFFFTTDNSWEQPVYLRFGRKGVNTYLSGLPWSTSKLHICGSEKRKYTGKSALKVNNVYFCSCGSSVNLTLPITEHVYL